MVTNVDGLFHWPAYEAELEKIRREEMSADFTKNKQHDKLYRTVRIKEKFFLMLTEIAEELALPRSAVLCIMINSLHNKRWQLSTLLEKIASDGFKEYNE